MQALILCRGNIGGIRSNPEGYAGAYLAPRPCNILELVRTLLVVQLAERLVTRVRECYWGD